ncbi:T9SS type A sorting domain-containing protein [Cyclonatronum proteinivorum]|uniref:T9SS type A sorting domain-containing protein n=1 Tax=Cyclonatronum proteinivorum TaxID=1457365 RepID=UPI0013DED245|nr:T9SS type A sorting domain-containing protein [Cyclonatronum proteinivorum]
MSFAAAATEIPGCTDPLAQNYNSEATVNDGSCTYASQTITFTERKELAPVLEGTSGMIVWQNLFWSHNDGNDLNIYGFTFDDPLDIQALELTGLTNNDWEELTQDEHYLYMGDIGNNYGSRTNLKIYKIEKQALLRGEMVVEEIAYSYDDQTDFSPGGSLITDYDAEAFIVTDEFIYVFTKQWTSRQTSVYRMPNEAGTHVAENIATFDVEGLITGSVYLPEERLIALIGYNFPEVTTPPFIWLLYDFQGDDFFGGNKRKLNFNLFSFALHQLEAITTIDGLTYYATNEFASTTTPFPVTVPQRIHQIDLSPFLSGYLESLPAPQAFYYRGSGSLSDVSNWASNPNGSGRIPESFALNGVSWHIVSPDSLILNEPLPVSGTDARVVLGDGLFPVHLHAEAEINGSVYMNENTSIHIEGGQPPDFEHVADGTTVTISGVPDLELSESSFWTLAILESAFKALDNPKTVSIRGDLSLIHTEAALQHTDGWRFVIEGSADQTLNLQPVWSADELVIAKVAGKVQLTEGSHIRITGLLSLESGELTLLDDTSITVASGASVWDEGELQPQLNFERLITSPQSSGGNQGHWINLASPVPVAIAGTGGLLEPLWTQGFPGANENIPGSDSSVLFFTAESEDTAYTPPAENAISPGVGALVYVLENNPPDDTNAPVDFSQPLRVSGQVPWFENGMVPYAFENLHTAFDGQTNGWNLLGNPFAAWLDWGKTEGWQAADMDIFAWVWEPAAQQYRLMEMGGGVPIPDVTTAPYIAPFQAFWVRASDENPALSILPEAITREKNAETFFRPETGETEPFVRFIFEADRYESAAAVRFGDRFESGTEPSAYDAPALWPLSHNFAYLALISESHPKPYMLMSQPVGLTERIEVGMYPYAVINAEPFTGLSEMRWVIDDQLPGEWGLTLIHHETGIHINLREESSYLFHTSEGMSRSQEPFTAASGPAQLFTQPVFSLIIEPEPATSAEPLAEMPATIKLFPNYPNPFNPQTVIRFALPETADVRLTVYDSLGRRVALLADGTKSAGVHAVIFNSGNLSSGLYFYEMRTQEASIVRKMTLLK